VQENNTVYVGWFVTSVRVSLFWFCAAVRLRENNGALLYVRWMEHMLRLCVCVCMCLFGGESGKGDWQHVRMRC
jgi:hypothetical protein